LRPFLDWLLKLFAPTAVESTPSAGCVVHPDMPANAHDGDGSEALYPELVRTLASMVRAEGMSFDEMRGMVVDFSSEDAALLLDREKGPR
jgi:hypothetical protein